MDTAPLTTTFGGYRHREGDIGFAVQNRADDLTSIAIMKHVEGMRSRTQDLLHQRRLRGDTLQGMQELAQSGDLYIQCSKLHPTCAPDLSHDGSFGVGKGRIQEPGRLLLEETHHHIPRFDMQGAQERGCKLTFEIGIPDPFPSYTLIKVKLAQDRAVGE